jgi:hypothetical protein
VGALALLDLHRRGVRLDVVAYDPFVEAVCRAVRGIPYGLRLASLMPLVERTPADFMLADLLVSVHGQEIVPDAVLARYSLGGINLHPCLWAYKGRDPVRRAVLAGETRLSVGAHRMTSVVDGGEVLAEEFVAMPPGAGLFSSRPLSQKVELAYDALYLVYLVVLEAALWKVGLFT